MIRERFVRMLLLFAALALVGAEVNAADMDRKYWKQGGFTCGKFVEDRQRPDTRQRFTEVMMAWLAGYVTAYNYVVPDTTNILGGSDLNSAILWIENYCRARPLKDTADAAEALIDVLYPTRHRTAREAGK